MPPTLSTGVLELSTAFNLSLCVGETDRLMKTKVMTFHFQVSLWPTEGLLWTFECFSFLELFKEVHSPHGDKKSQLISRDVAADKNDTEKTPMKDRDLIICGPTNQLSNKMCSSSFWIGRCIPTTVVYEQNVNKIWESDQKCSQYSEFWGAHIDFLCNFTATFNLQSIIKDSSKLFMWLSQQRTTKMSNLCWNSCVQLPEKTGEERGKECATEIKTVKKEVLVCTEMTKYGNALSGV